MKFLKCIPKELAGVFTIAKKLMAAALIVLAVTGSCSRAKERNPMEPRTVNIRDAEITGNWKNYIEIEDGDYLLEDIGSSFSRHTAITVSLKLKETFSGSLNSPADTLRLVPLTQGGSPMTDDEFHVSSKEKFNEFVLGAPGDKARITFADLFGKEEAFQKIMNFEGKTAEEYKPAAKAAETPSSTVSNSAAAGSVSSETSPADTATDASFAHGTQARTGPRVVAVPELEATGSISQDLIVGLTGQATAALLANSNVGRVVDYNQINRIMQQHKFEAGDWSNPAKYAELGRALNVDTITVGTIALGQKILMMQEYNVSIQLIDISTMSVVGACSVSCGENGSLLKSALEKMDIKR
jgi:nitrous oxide reductase accessory protein NosL